MSMVDGIELMSPKRKVPCPEWGHYRMWVAVAKILKNLPQHITAPEDDEVVVFSTYIDDLNADELFTLNTQFASVIERGVVTTLNRCRNLWDDGNYRDYRFVRQTSIFPDVLLQNKKVRTDIIMGIELKGWYVFAKEGMPCFRYCVSPQCCHPAD